MINEATNSVLIPSYFKFTLKNLLNVVGKFKLLLPQLFVVEYLNTKLYPEEEY